jgi:hypothetical protein
MLVPNLIVINYPKPTTGANALTKSFSDSTRLHVNFQKKLLVPINVSAERIHHLA